MKFIITALLGILGLLLLLNRFVPEYLARNNVEDSLVPISVPIEVQNTFESVLDTVGDAAEALTDREVLPPVSIVAENLTIPWDMVFLSPSEFLVSERDGTIVRINTVSGIVTEIEVPSVFHKGEGGLLGMVAHPNFLNNNYLYIYRTSTLNGATNASVNEVIRYEYRDNSLVNPVAIVENIPGSLFHNGGRIAFGPDGYLYVATGDARDPDSAQDINSLAGAILRVTEDGEVPPGNIFGSEIYSYGHRNPQGLAWDDRGNLWSTEHGRTTATLTGMDEINRIEEGRNYGWPDSEGDTVREGTVAPALHSGAHVTWAPAGATYYDGSVFFGGLRGERLYEAVLSEDRTEVIELKEHFVGEFGRIRTTLLGPDGALYMMTSNRDGRGVVSEGYDKVIRLNPLQFR